MAPVSLAQFAIRRGTERGVAGHPLPGVATHVGDVKIGPDVVHARFARHVLKAAAAIPVQVVASEIVGDVEAGPAVAIVVAPGRSEAEPVVVLVYAGFRGDIFEPTRSIRMDLIAKQEVGRAVLRVMIRDGVAILVLALEISVGAKVEIEPAVAIVIGGSHPGEAPLRVGAKVKSIRPEREGSIALIEKEDRTGRAQDHQILQTAVAEIEEQSAGGVVQNPHAGPFGDVFELAVADFV